MNIDNEYIAIYELNGKTPLFARVAFDAMEIGNFDEAVSILKAGIELFGNYPTPYFLLGKALLKIGNSIEAKEYFQKGNALLNDSSTLNYYSNSVNENENTEIDVSDTEVVIDKSDDLEELADILQTAKIEVNYDEPTPRLEAEQEDFKPLKGLVSETLASIYFDQSNYKEAKAIYETLIEIQPERENYFKTKIFEIESRMKTQKSDD